ncbi:MAG: response regulator transcription factor [Thermoleophilia bacterium]|nr:response regulator transcription factor [Thermoleophilia bacterium]
MSTEPIKIILIDDHPVILEGLTSGLSEYPRLEITGTASSVDDARRLISAGGFDLMVTDLMMPEVEDGLGLINFCTSHIDDCKVVVLSYSSRPEDIFRANQAGANAYLIKDSDLDEIAEAFNIVHGGGRPPLKPELEAALWQRLQDIGPDEFPQGLTEREWKILRFMTLGDTNEEIAERLFISPRVVRRSNTSIYSKLGVRNRSEAIAHAMRENWFS